MSEPLIVATTYQDLAEFTEGFADRVDEGMVILYGPIAYADGDSVPFQVLLSDGAAILEGSATVTAFADGGEERDPDSRFDTWLGELALTGASEIVFERLMAYKRGEVSTTMSLPDEAIEPVSTEVQDIDAAADVFDEPEPAPEPEPVVEAAPAPTPTYRSVAPLAPAEPIVGGGKNAGMTAGARGLPPPAAPSSPSGFSVELGLKGNLGRPVMPAAWTPEPPPREPSTAPTGNFEYGASVPLPARPPRPEMDAARRVAPAPAATTEAAYRAAREALGFAMPTASDDYEAAPAAAYRAPVHAASDVVEDAPVSTEETFDVGDDAFDVDGSEG
jgi:hypothetical protein